MVGRICILRHNYYPLDVRVRREVNVLLDAGFSVDVVCLRLPGQPLVEQVRGATVYRLPLAHVRGNRARYLFQYAASLGLSAVMAALLHLRRRYDLIQVGTMPDFLVFAGLFPRLLGAKLVLDMLDPMPELFMAKYRVGPEHPLTRFLVFQEGKSMDQADLVITVLEEVKRRLIERHGPREIAVVMNCPDHTEFPRRDPATAAALRAAHRDSAGRFVLLSHGVVVERLGYDTIVRAVALLKDEIPNLEFRLAGIGEDYAAELVALAHQLGVGDRFRWLGFVPGDQVPDLLAQADLGIAANKSDGFGDVPLPTKLLEYMWMGTPAIASRTATIAHYIDDTQVAFFEPNNERDLADRITELYHDQDRRERLATNAARFFERYNWSSEGRRYRDLLYALLPKERLSACAPDEPLRERAMES
jgi:glycosyltransferase involved in cell wall biosynthesis